MRSSGLSRCGSATTADIYFSGKIHDTKVRTPLQKTQMMFEIAKLSAQDCGPCNDASKNSAPSLWLLLLIATGALFLRIDNLGFVTESLSWEDGFLYLTQAHQIGLESLWIPYVGYLNTYPRIVALLSIPLPLVAAPYLFFSAWCISFYSIAWVLKSRASVLGNNFFLIAFLVVAIVMQPNHGTPFFHLNTSNVFLAVALVLYICIPSDSPPTPLEIVFITIASLTGPYSTFMLPVLAAQLILFRDFRVRKLVYLIVTAGGLIQLAVMASDEMPRTPELLGYSEWARAIFSFLFFGEGDRLVLTAACIFWLVTLAYTLKLAAVGEDRTEGRSWLNPAFCLVSAVIFFALGAVAAGDHLPHLSPMDLLSRYFLIPYSLIFLAALISTRRHRPAQITVMCLISTICGARFVVVDGPDRATSTGLAAHANMQWKAFTRLQKIKPDMVIPINTALPVYPAFPGVQVTKTAGPDTLSNAIPLDVGSSAGSSSVELHINQYCEGHNYIGLEVHVWRSRMGFAAVYWGREGNFDSDHSMRRFYPDKDAVMLFAFRRELSDDLVRLELAQGVAASPVVRTANEWFARSGFVVAEPTAGGGTVKIDRILLFCLH